MKLFNCLSLVFILFVCMLSCKGKKTAATPSSSKTQDQNATTIKTPPITNSTVTPVTSSKKDTTVDFVVSFYSIGEGIDATTKEEFEKFITKQHEKVTYETTSWGREGETDYCLKINDLSSTEQADFLKKAKELLSKSKLVHIEENTKCVHKH